MSMRDLEMANVCYRKSIEQPNEGCFLCADAGWGEDLIYVYPACDNNPVQGDLSI